MSQTELPEPEVTGEVAEIPSRPYSPIFGIGALFVAPLMLVVAFNLVDILLRGVLGMPNEITTNMLTSSLGFVLATLGFFVVMGRLGSMLDVLKLRSFHWSHIIIGFCTALTVYISAMIIGILSYYVQNYFDIEPGGPNSTSQGIAESTGSPQVLLMVILVAICAPIAEELFFRGTLLGALVQDSKRYWIRAGAVLLVSVAFALSHVSQGATGTMSDWLGAIIPGLVGLSAAVLTLKLKSLYPAIFTHLFYNGVVFFSIATG